MSNPKHTDVFDNIMPVIQHRLANMRKEFPFLNDPEPKELIDKVVKALKEGRDNVTDEQSAMTAGVMANAVMNTMLGFNSLLTTGHRASAFGLLSLQLALLYPELRDGVEMAFRVQIADYLDGFSGSGKN